MNGCGEVPSARPPWLAPDIRVGASGWHYGHGKELFDDAQDRGVERAALKHEWASFDVGTGRPRARAGDSIRQAMTSGGKNTADNRGATMGANGDFDKQRWAMVEQQIRERGIVSQRVLEAMLAVPRHEFVSAEYAHAAYTDQPLPIGEGQTISQPFMVAAMTEALELNGTERVLEVGTGSGYQAAVLSLLARQVYSVESHASLAHAAQQRLTRLGYTNVHVHTGDGTLGLPEQAPFEAIVVTAAAPHVPPPLVEQLTEGGLLVVPVGSAEQQELLQVRKAGGRTTSRVLHYCRFVPLVGRHGWRNPLRG